MNISQLLRGIVGSAQPIDAKTLELKIGQVVKGIVLQLLTEQDAMVNIGGVPIRARLETPLQVGQMTLLQVQPESSTGQVVLKPLGSSNVQILETSLPDLVKSFGMKDTEANRNLVQQLHAAAIPLNAKTVKAFQPIGNMAPNSTIPPDQWTEAAIVAYKKGLPLKSEIVLPLQQAMFGKALPQSLEQLKGSLQQLIQTASPQEENSDTMSLVRKLVETINGLSTGRIAPAPGSLEQGGRMTNPSLNLAQQDANLVSRTLTNENVTTPARQGTGTAQAILPASTPATPPTAVTPAQMPATPPTASSQVSTQPPTASTPTPTVVAPTTATSATPASATVPVPTVTATTTQAISPTTPVTVQAIPVTDQAASPLVSSKVTGASELSEQTARIQTTQALTSEQSTQGTESYAVGDDVGDDAVGDGGDPWIKQLLKQLGVDHEHRTANLFTQSTDAPDMDELQFRHESVKGLLLQLASSDQLPNSVKDAAQQVVQQITGQQLLLGAERGSPFSLVTLFVPIQHQNGTDTASVHIQSKRKQGGNLDVDNCRLLFDLRMSTLGDTLVDVQVVNRIVSLQVHNDFPMIGNLLDSLKPEIETAMNQIGFQFISMKNVPYPDPTTGRSGETTPSSDSRSSVSTTYHSKPYKGVDFKI